MQKDVTDKNIINYIQIASGKIIQITNGIIQGQWKKGFHYDNKSIYMTSENIWDFDRGTDGSEYQLHQLTVICNEIMKHLGINVL